MFISVFFDLDWCSLLPVAYVRVCVCVCVFIEKNCAYKCGVCVCVRGLKMWERIAAKNRRSCRQGNRRKTHHVMPKNARHCPPQLTNTMRKCANSKHKNSKHIQQSRTQQQKRTQNRQAPTNRNKQIQTTQKHTGMDGTRFDMNG